MKTIIITGASSGIGKAAAIHFAENGWKVAATMRTPEKAQALAKFKNVTLYPLDVTNSDSIDKAISAIIKDFGKVDVLVNNAGYVADGVFESMNDDVIQRQFDTNVFGLMRVTRAIIPHFRSNKGGTIIQVASMGGRLTIPLYSIYHGTKWAVEGFSESLHYELKQFNIKVRIIEPGAIKTDFYGRSREEIKTNLGDYKGYVEKINKSILNAGDNGEPPAKVAKAIMKAATDKGWKMRYPVGSPAPLTLWLRKRIPDSWYFAIVRSQMEK